MDREKPLLSAPPAFIALRTALPNPSPDFTPDLRIPLIPGWLQPFLQRHPAQIPAQEMGWAPPLPAAELPGLQLMNAISADGFIIIREPGRAWLRRGAGSGAGSSISPTLSMTAPHLLLLARCCWLRGAAAPELKAGEVRMEGSQGGLEQLSCLAGEERLGSFLPCDTILLLSCSDGHGKGWRGSGS